MKKRILSAVALLCMVVCLSGCSNIEWVTQKYEDFTFELPAQWEQSEYSDNRFSSSSEEVPGYFSINPTSTLIYDSEQDSIASFINASDGTVVEEKDITIAGTPGYYCEVSYTMEGETFSMYYYVILHQDHYYSFTFGDCSESIRNHVIQSIQINE